MSVIRCDCGFEASEGGEGGLVEQAQNHARRVHDMELPAELVLALARSAPGDCGPPHPEEDGQR